MNGRADTDFDGTTYAYRRRWIKAMAMYHYAWDHGLTPDQIAAMSPREIARLATLAGVNPPRRPPDADSGRPSRTKVLLLTFMVERTFRAQGWPAEEGNRIPRISDAEAVALVRPARGTANRAARA